MLNYKSNIKWGETVLIRKNLSELKNSKPFYLFDLILYSAVVLFIAAMFAAVFFAGKSGDSQGFYVLFDNRIIAEYLYSDGTFSVENGYEAHFSVGEEIYFYPDATDFSDYNLISIDTKNKTVYISDATCAGHDCTTQKVSVKGGFIYCAPHKLKIVPMGLNDPVSG